LKRLLIRPGAIGDFIVSLPALELLKAEYTEVWSAGPNQPLARFAARTRSIASTGLDLLGLPGVTAPPSLIDELHKFDSIVSWYGSNRPEFREAVAGLGLPFEFLEALPGHTSRIHAADFYMLQAAGIAGRIAEAVPRLDCPRRDGGFIAIHPFSGSPRKNWPLDRYKELIRLVRPRINVRCILSPGSSVPEGMDTELMEPDLYRLACRLAESRLYIGNDSGITHLAAAAGAPVIALFGPSDPAVWAPRGHCVKVIATDPAGGPMGSIPLEEVMEAATSWI
jgi:hypothetical protein